MIVSSFGITQLDAIEPLNEPSVHAFPIPPLQRVKNFSPEEFEAFIGEWAISCAKQLYKDVYRIGSSGDMGRDVIGEYADGSCDYYQCKRYEGKLTPSEYWLEFGKLCYYTFNKDIPMPKKYYIISSQGIGAKLLRIIKNPEEIRKGLIEQWDTKCCKGIISGQKIDLKGSLLDYVKNFDFNVVDTYSIEKIIEEHRKTNYFYFRFGGTIKPQRGRKVLPPNIPEQNEFNYVNKVLAAYSQYKRIAVDLNMLQTIPELLTDFNDNRINFYSAESLKRSIRDIFANEDHFGVLKSEMHSGIKDFMKSDFKDGYKKLIKTMHESTRVNLSVSIIDRELHFITNEDRKGICHHLANEDQINWVI
ncbi:ABC-three component system protein [Paenibacillus sp. FSL P4-0113]|uniref:ABC-three component system protein n=1 Tax=Paenibacillus sp. FSL P4-0113 TaxID=2921630 RepID=UPI0030F6D730